MVVGSCPTVFELLKLRKTKRYRSLRHHFFTPKEKLWLCSTLSTRKSEKRLSESQYKSHLLAVSTRYNISEDGLEEWMKAFHSGQILTAGSCSSIYDDSPVDRAGVEVLQELMSQMRSIPLMRRNLWVMMESKIGVVFWQSKLGQLIHEGSRIVALLFQNLKKLRTKSIKELVEDWKIIKKYRR